MSTSVSPRCTVLLCVRNGLPWIREAWASLLHQTLTDLEILVLDDGSTDGTTAWLRDAVGSHPSAELHAYHASAGLTARLVEGVERARGEFIARLDADDRSHPARLERQVRVLDERPDLLAVGTDAVRFHETPPPWTRLSGPPSVRTVSFADLLEGNSLFHSSMIFRRSLVDQGIGYRQPFRFSQDYDLWLRVVRMGSIGVLPEPLTQIRVHHHAITSAFQYKQLLFAEQARRLAHTPWRSNRDDLDRTGQLPTVAPSVSARLRRQVFVRYCRFFLTAIGQKKPQVLLRLGWRMFWLAPCWTLRWISRRGWARIVRPRRRPTRSASVTTVHGAGDSS